MCTHTFQTLEYLESILTDLTDTTTTNIESCLEAWFFVVVVFLYRHIHIESSLHSHEVVG